MTQVEKCGICGRPFDFDPLTSCGLIQTRWAAPHNFSTKFYNPRSQTSKEHPQAISLTCIACTDNLALISDCSIISWVHNKEDDIYRAYDVAQFAEIPLEILQQIELEAGIP